MFALENEKRKETIRNDLRAIGAPAVVSIDGSARTDKDDTALRLAEGREGVLDEGDDREEVDIKVAILPISMVGILGEH